MSVSESEDELTIEQMSFAHPYYNTNCSNPTLICFTKFSFSSTRYKSQPSHPVLRTDEDDR